MPPLIDRVQPPPFRVALLDASGQLVETWRRFFLTSQVALTQILAAKPSSLAGTQQISIDDSNSFDDVFPPLTGGINGIATFSGVIDDNTTNATMYPVWVSATPGNEAIKSSSSKLTWNPSSLSGSLAIGITPSLVNSLYVYTGTLATTAGTLFTGGQFLSAIQPPTNSTTQIFGVNATVSCLATGTVTLSGPFAGVVAQVSNGGTSSGAVSDMRGFNASAFNSGASPTSTLYAAFIRYGMLSTGGITNAYGVYINSFQSGAGTITANMGVAVLTPTNGGPITTNLGIKIFGQGASGITHGYGLNILETTGAATTNVSLCIGVAPTGVSYSLYNASVVASLFKGPIYNTVAEADLSYTIATPVTLATVVMNSGQRRLIINPAGTIAVLTVTLPASPVDGQISGISFTQIVSALTVNAPGGATVVGPPTASAVNSEYNFVYQASSTSWFPAA